MNITPSAAVRGLQVLFPALPLGPSFCPVVVRGVVTAIRAPREVTEAQLVAAAALPVEPASLPVPDSVPLWAFRSALREADLMETVKAAVAANADLTEFLEYGNTVDRNSSSLAALAAQLGKSKAEVDDLFRRAAAKKL